MQSQDELILFIANFVYEKIFKNYTTKQWGIDFKEIDEETISRVKIKISHDDRYFEDKYQGIPLKGYSSMIENILDNKNIEILLNTDFKDINNDYKMVFYTGSIDEFYDYKYGILPYRSLEFDIQIRDEEYYQNTSMTNYPNNYDFTRITEHKYFLNEKSSHTVISLEYPKEFDINKNERFYPIKTNKNIELYNKYYELYKKDKNVIILGRLGTYRYINMDETIFQALEIFRNFKD
jgi:UDP-galactopyranose mutase